MEMIECKLHIRQLSPNSSHHLMLRFLCNTGAFNICTTHVVSVVDGRNYGRLNHVRNTQTINHETHYCNDNNEHLQRTTGADSGFFQVECAKLRKPKPVLSLTLCFLVPNVLGNRLNPFNNILID